MRIYNGTKSTLILPLTGNERVTIAPKTPSGNVLCSNDFLSLLVTSYTTDEVAIIASGPFEVTACANVPTAVNYVVQSLDEAIQRFAPKPETKEPAPKVVDEEPAAPEAVVEPELEVEEEPAAPEEEEVIPEDAAPEEEAASVEEETMPTEQHERRKKDKKKRK
ncbi:MAG: hypothetical protein J6I84_02640 [Bacilli bacterium]|nr:hypothetical protein [Bacilli bacterium]